MMSPEHSGDPVVFGQKQKKIWDPRDYTKIYRMTPKSLKSYKKRKSRGGGSCTSPPLYVCAVRISLYVQGFTFSSHKTV